MDVKNTHSAVELRKIAIVEGTKAVWENIQHAVEDGKLTVNVYREAPGYDLLTDVTSALSQELRVGGFLVETGCLQYHTTTEQWMVIRW